jgi:sugar lactone lactonase YvrE
MKKRALFALFVLIAAYLTLWPVPIAPVAWQAVRPPGYVGVHAENQKLGSLQHIFLSGEVGPEHVVIGPDQKLYTTVQSGHILRMNPDGSDLQVWADTHGRVLGFDFDSAGNLIAADAMRGLLAVAPDRTITVLTQQVQGQPIVYADAVVVAKSGQIYFTDASTRFPPQRWGGTFEASILDILEQSATGRVLAYDPSTKQTRVVARGLSFANGIALSQDQQSLFVCETGKYRVWKLSVLAQDLAVTDAPQNRESPQAQVLLDNLPGYPDNLMRGQSGRIWLGFAKPRNAVIDKLSGQPFLRKLILRLPRALWPIPRPYGHVLAFTESGEVIADLQDPSGKYPETTSVTETTDRLYIQSLHAKTLGWLPK